MTRTDHKLAGHPGAAVAVGQVWEALQSGGTINGTRLQLVFDNLPNGSVQAQNSSSGQPALIRLHLNAGQWSDSMSIGNDYMMGILVHELGHVFDLLYGPDASTIVTPDVIDFNNSLSVDNNYLVDSACFRGSLYGKRP